MQDIRLYSIYDLQAKRIDYNCNIIDMNKAIRNIREFAESDRNTTGISDNDLFIDWEFVLFEHYKIVEYPCRADFKNILKSIFNIKIIYPQLGEMNMSEIILEVEKHHTTLRNYINELELIK